MGGFFGAISKRDVTLDIFFGVDYHSHLGTRRGGMVIHDSQDGFQREIHSIENSPFRTKFEADLNDFHGTSGIGCISDSDPQPLLVRSHLGLFAITTVGIINNAEELVEQYNMESGHQFMAMSSGQVNSTELTAALINQKDDLVSGIRHAQQVIDGSITILILTPDSLIAARDAVGRLPVILGRNEDGYCVSFESFAYHKLGYDDHRELGPGEIVRLTADSEEVLAPPGDKMRICAFLWTYYGYPNSRYEGINVEVMRNRNGVIMAKADRERGLAQDLDYVAGVPDSGLPHAIGYANESGVPYARPFVKYTPTWPRSFMPANQDVRNQVAKMKQIPPIMYGCKYLNFSRSNSDMELLARRTIQELEGDEGQQHLDEYADASTKRGQCMLHAICEKLHFSSLGYQSLDGLLESIGLDRDKVCTYCWNGKE